MERAEANVSTQKGVGNDGNFEAQMKRLQEDIKSFMTPFLDVFKNYIDPPIDIEDNDSESDSEEGTSGRVSPEVGWKQETLGPNVTVLMWLDKKGQVERENRDYNRIAKKLAKSIRNARKSDGDGKDIEGDVSQSTDADMQDDEAFKAISNKLSNIYKKALEKKNRGRSQGSKQLSLNDKEFNKISEKLFECIRKAVERLLEYSLKEVERRVAEEAMKLDRLQVDHDNVGKQLAEKKREMELAEAELDACGRLLEEVEELRDDSFRNSVRDI